LIIHPVTATVNTQGTALVTIGHSLSNIKQKVYQISFGLGLLAPSPQVAIHLNGVPWAASAAMQQSVFASIPGAAPYAQENVWYGPPYIYLQSGDALVCGVIGAIPGDQFTASAILEEYDFSASESMGS
jgi:hypothetical protein